MKRGVINPVIGVTDAQLRSQIRSALRKVWRNSSGKKFIEAIRVPYVGSGRFKYGVVCVGCNRMMGQSESAHMELVGGGLSKKKKLVYNVDHIEGNDSFLSLEELGGYTQSLIYGEMRVLCLRCHRAHTHDQSKKRTRKTFDEAKLKALERSK